jgi:hypothetical protein
MTTKADYNAEEWSTIAQAPVLAGLRVVAAHRGGTIRESLAIGKVYSEARRNQGESLLLDELVATPPALDVRQVQAQGDIAGAAEAKLREAVRLLSEKASPDEVDAYKRFVLDLAHTAAEAHKEGGFIGIGGKPVSEEEQAALDEIGALLGVGA